MFEKLFPEFDWVVYDVYNDHFPNDLNECDVYMATGSSHSVYEDIDWNVLGNVAAAGRPLHGGGP